MKEYFKKGLIRFVTFSSLIATLAIPVFAITQGENAAPGKWQSTVGLVGTGTSVQNGYFCVGSLIAPRWVVTAAHCVSGVSISRFEVVSGLYALNQAAGTQQHAIVRTLVHPEFNSPQLNADIALIELATASSSPTLAVFSESNSLAGNIATVVGWGVTQLGGVNSNILQQASLPIVSNAECADVYTGVLAIQPSMLCAGDGQGGPSICTRDSGSPLMANFQGQDVLLGVASFSTGCGLNGFYSGFSRVSALLGFLQQHVANLETFARPPGLFIPPILLQLLLSD